MSGAPPQVLLIHGFASDAERTWGRTGWIAALEEAGRAWQAPDLRGHGGAEKPDDISAYQIPALLDHLLTGVGDGVLDVVGYSMGGALALELALSRPERVRRLVAGGFGLQTPFDVGEAERLLEDVRAGRPAPPEAAGGLWAMTDSAPGDDLVSLAASLLGFATSNRCTDYQRFRGPALLFGGAEDPIVATLPELAGKLSGSKLVMLPRRNHLTALSSGRTRREAIGFLEES
jgi:pimeloyl-ACP methyl ester carboxylesterase